ncbi:hypothetical protein [Celerinatantimonas sp. MCCC 1A17872]|uniref:hypothetical protein n=1 Tax=Celerinatantimonas sp. MCCC 1A17872 TaxID=3177514 RepID=UPI0038C6CA40
MTSHWLGDLAVVISDEITTDDIFVDTSTSFFRALTSEPEAVNQRTTDGTWPVFKGLLTHSF